MLNQYKGLAKLPPGTQLACVLVRATPTKTKATFRHDNRAVIYLTHDNALDFQHYAELTEAELLYLAGVADAYALTQSSVDGSQLRDAVAKLLRAAGTVPFRDAVHLVPAAHAPLVAALERLIPGFDPHSPSGANRITTIAYLDTPRQNAQLKEVVAEHIDREITTKVAHAVGYVQRRRQLHKTAGAGKRATLVGELLALAARIAAYEALLGANLAELRRQAADTEQAVRTILDG